MNHSSAIHKPHIYISGAFLLGYNDYVMKEKSQRYLPEFVYGSIDGLITTFAIVTGSIGASLSAAVILVLGFANVLADGFSMGSSNYLSAQSEESLGYDDEGKRPLRRALATFFSFVLIGIIPLIPFVIAALWSAFTPYTITTSVAATGLTFLGVGWYQGKVVGKSRLLTALRNLLIGGGAAAISYVVGYILSNFVV